MFVCLKLLHVLCFSTSRLLFLVVVMMGAVVEVAMVVAVVEGGQ